MKNELLSKTLAQIVNENHQTAAVFEKYNLDFCCRGKRSLGTACEERNLPVDLVVSEVQSVVEQEMDVAKDFDKLTLAELAGHIVSTHHAYTKRELTQIFAYLQKISSKHGDRHTELYAIFENFASLKEELEMHMHKEEAILFPRIKELESEGEGRMNIQAPIDVMEDEHEHAGDLLQKIRNHTNDYTPPADACTTYRLTFAALEAFEKDLHQHIHLENNILFPKALELYSRQNRVN